jgi:threonylcarbamoyladenosine tRNA methylthiotransferase MtaB
MIKKKFKIYTLGCKVNQYDSARIRADLTASGLQNTINMADIALINTCAVTQKAIIKSKQMLNKAKKENPDAKIILAGCWPRAYREEAELNEKSDAVVNGKNSGEIMQKLKDWNFIAQDYSLHGILPVTTDKVRYFIAIQDGCEQFCSYCIIPFTRGELFSRSEKEILTELRLAIDKGYREIILCGIHLGLYGREKGSGNKTNLVKLIKKILKFKKLGRIRLSSIEINEVSDELIDLMKNEKKICPFLHLPLQSGSDKILRLMNRPYSTGMFYDKIMKIRKMLPDIAISTDIIVGFPGESADDFNTTTAFIAQVNFCKLHVFPFSVHKKTAAFKFPQKINREIIQQRAEKLRALSGEFEKKYLERFKGRKVSVLIEKIESGILRGKSQFYFDVEKPIKSTKVRRGDIVEVSY